ncbi:hypothetical protein BX616_010436 [Lobosporangium transversale]|nr:hypothetical protein BX616_010436 [Lobosporangium transversale]
MSQNSPSGDPASSPSLSASSPTSTTSKKRTRASAEQLAILEDTFLTNQSPNSKVREILAKKVKMSERSIQIWFQNRRAKVKQAQKRSELVQQEAMKAQYLSSCAAAGITPQPFYGFGAPTAGAKAFPMAAHLHPSATARATLSRTNSYDAARASAVQARFAQTGLGINVPGAANAALWSGQLPYGMQPQNHPGFAFRPNVPQAMAAARGVKRSFDATNGTLTPGAVPKALHFPGAVGADGLPEGVASPDVMFAAGLMPGASQIPTMPTFNCDNLAIGTWRRMSTPNTDLSCFYCPTTRIMTWQIIDHAARFKMTFPLSAISRIEFYEVDAMYSQVDFDLLETPQFFMETVSEDQTRDWKKCSDFTEGKQATLVMRHTIHGISSALKMQVMSLTIAYPPLQGITHYRETQFQTQFHGFTAPIPQISQFLDPSQYDRRFAATPMNPGSYLGLNDGLDSGEGSDIGEDFYDGSNTFGTPFSATTSALLDMNADGTQQPRLKSRRTASMPTPAVNNFLTTGLNAVPYHSSPLSMYSTTGVALETSTSTPGLLPTSAAAAVAATVTPAVGESQTALPASSVPTTSTAPSQTVQVPAPTATASTITSSTAAETSAASVTVSASSTVTPAPAATLAPSMIATATTMPKVTITTLSDSADNGGAATESTTIVHGENDQEKDKGETQQEEQEETKQTENQMGLTSQFNEFLAQAVVSTSAQMSAPFVSAAFGGGMMYGHAHPQAFQLGTLDDGSDSGYEFNSGYYGMMPEQASFVSMSDLEGSTGQQTDGEESSYGPY